MKVSTQIMLAPEDVKAAVAAYVTQNSSFAVMTTDVTLTSDNVATIVIDDAKPAKQSTLTRGAKAEKAPEVVKPVEDADPADNIVVGEDVIPAGHPVHPEKDGSSLFSKSNEQVDEEVDEANGRGEPSEPEAAAAETPEPEAVEEAPKPKSKSIFDFSQAS